MTSFELESYINQAFNLGQIYWQQADSDYASDYKKADATYQKFLDLLRKALTEFGGYE